MSSNPKLLKAFRATRALGIPDEEVNPVLEKLLKVYNNNWELIEEDNFRTLVDAYFELKEDKQSGGKRKAPISHDSRERPTQKLHMIDVDEDDRVSSTTDRPSQILSVEDNEAPPKTFGQEIIETPHPSLRDKRPITSSQASRSRLSEVDKSLKPEKTSSAGHCNKLQLGPVSTSCRGSSETSTGNHSHRYQNKYIKDDTSARKNNTTHCKASMDLASSPLGQVKISLNCDCALGPPNFHTPNLADVMKFMEENLRLRKIVGPQFSMVKALNDLCESYLKLGGNSNREDSNPACSNSKNLALAPQQALPQHEKKYIHYLHDISKGSERVKISLVDEIGKENLPKFNYIPNNIIYQNANVNISLARIADQGCCSDCTGSCLLSSFPCACAQETGGEFAYTPYGLLKDEFLMACMAMKKEPQHKDFVYCKKCPLERSKNGYKSEPCKGHLLRKFIKECWRKCGCNMKCGNRVVQRGLRSKLQVFLTCEGKGWGLRTLEDLPKGSFICEYVGEILTNMESYERILQNGGTERHTYPVTLDADWGSERILKDEEALCLDATTHGNVARFINHRCFDCNLIDIPVEVETPDRHYYHVMILLAPFYFKEKYIELPQGLMTLRISVPLISKLLRHFFDKSNNLAFFTNTEVHAYDELTWDYGIDFDDHEHPIKAFQCCCGSKFCRDKNQKGNRLLEGKFR